ncbi:Methyltransferase type 12 [Chlorobaculum parvum NCIB 8327]|uniref:Methyltransferase type 12 n=1 Tax=Chlorobaculum parvum (strain DSM 263 / NCIMB 8327) TaxID=517417 RepID=B3QPJ7_CHLP8|nr:methyltransferase domain-containing protein [Chlorobaculum parvum]ACF11850.1 Methyltransferase type 12 [Chlorobaculum parvum NCIB 8327]
MNKKKELSRACPVCGCGYGEIIHHMDFVLEPENPLPTSYDVVKCTDCSFLFADVDADQAKYDLYYELLSKYEDKNTASGYGDTEYDKKRLSVTADFISGLLSREKAILDIGSGGGGLLKELKEKGYSDLNALEPASKCVHEMPSYINGKSGSLFDDLMQIFEGKKFDLIILSHVAEHIYDLKGALKNVISLLKADGKIYIEVPDASRYANFYKVPFYYFDVEHINHFDRNSLDHLALSVGLASNEVVEKIIEVSGTDLYPAVGMVFIRSNAGYELKKYVAKSLLDTRLESLKNIIDSQLNIAIWGAGNYTKRLLASSMLGEAKISFFVDSDSGKQGKSLFGRPVFGPNVLCEFSGPVVVASALFASEILEQIKKMKIDNQVIVL